MLPEELVRLTPQQQTEWAREHIEDWPAFEAMLRKSLADLSCWPQWV